METEKISFKLIGSDFDDNSFEVKAFGGFLSNLGKVISESNEVLNHNDAEIMVKVDSRFVPGSFEFLITVNQVIHDTVLPLLISDGATGIINAYTLIAILFSQGKSVVDVIKHLKGDPPQKVEINGGSALIYSTSDSYLEVSKECLSLFMSPKVKNSLGTAVVSAMSSMGAKQLEIRGCNSTNRISKEDVVYFDNTSTEMDEILGVEDVTTTLEIVSVSFDPTKHWEFKSKSGTFFADILCPDFIKKIAAGEVFKKGDHINCTMRIEFYKTEQQTRKRRTILSVTSHYQPYQMTDQLSLQIEGGV